MGLLIRARKSIMRARLLVIVGGLERYK